MDISNADTHGRTIDRIAKIFLRSFERFFRLDTFGDVIIADLVMLFAVPQYLPAKNL